MRIFSLLMLAVLLAGFGQVGRAQTTPAPPDSTAKQYRYVESMPVFPGGQQALLKLLTDSLQYPPQALRDGTQGKVYLAFVVGPDGRTTDIRVKQGLRPDLDAEALRQARRLARVQWQPGTQNGRPVSVAYTVPISFSINAQPGAYPPDSLDLAPGPRLVLPTGGWHSGRGPLPADKGLVCGSCVQRLGFSSGGIPQYVRLRHLGAGKVVRISVKPTMRSRSENDFCVALPPGRYALQQYEYGYGVEALRKHRTGALTDTRYVFGVRAGQLSYVGVWDFSAPQQPRFRLDQAALAERINPTYTKLGFAEAVLALPQ